MGTIFISDPNITVQPVVIIHITLLVYKWNNQHHSSIVLSIYSDVGVVLICKYIILVSQVDLNAGSQELSESRISCKVHYQVASAGINDNKNKG